LSARVTLSFPPPLLTPRLQLRPVAEADLPDLLAVNGDEATTRFLPYVPWASLADGQAWLQRIQTRQAAGDTLQFVLALRETGQVVGSCLLFRFEPGSARAELGYVLGRAHWRQGLMREGLQALISAAFGPLGLRRLEADVHPDNAASLGLLASLGFQREGLLRQRWTAKGQTSDSVMLGLLRDDPRPA
jgi:ribosomal-protein-alanine N-acetyltransferase